MATDLGTQDLPRLTLTGGRGTLQAVHHSRGSELDKGPVGTASVLGPAAGPHRWSITPAAEAASHLPTEHLTARRIGRGIQPEESAPGSFLAGRGVVLRILTTPQSPTVRAEFPGPTMRIHPFDSIRFHILLNSLFKVLFNFPSRYLSAIGLVPVFSLRWSLPSALGCIPKQPDSKEARSHRVRRPNRPDTRFG